MYVAINLIIFNASIFKKCPKSKLFKMKKLINFIFISNFYARKLIYDLFLIKISCRLTIIFCKLLINNNFLLIIHHI